MSILRSPAFRLYVLGLGSVVIGAAASAVAESMWPLALGGSFALMSTVALVREIRRRARERRRPPRG